MQVEILTPKGMEFSREAKEIIVPTMKGEITVLPHHVPLVSVLKSGIMTVVTDEGRMEKEIEGGLLEVTRTKAVILLKKF